MVAACAALALVGVSASMPNAAADDKLKTRQHQAHSQVQSAKGDLDESSKALRGTSARLAHARSDLQAAQRRLAVAQRGVDAAARVDAAMEAKLQVAEHNLALAQAALDSARRRVSDQKIAIGQLVASDYANGDPALMGLSVMLKSQDPAEVTTQMNTVTALMSRESTMLKQLKAARAETAAQESVVAQASAAVASRRQAARENLVRKEGLEQSAAQARAEVATLVARARAAQVAAARVRAHDRRQLQAATRQEDKIRRLIMDRAMRQHGGYSGDTGGFLFRPVPGYITSPYGWRIHPIYHYWGLHDGTDFHAPCGTPERAAGSGTVITKDWSDVYGNRLYLDLGKVNGKNMTVVYNHAESYRVGVGARVHRGEILGYAGTTGWSTGCHLHFTVLVNGSPVDPMKFI
jgi:murein DD-endopeptidase MepM/ murein hydrolase activator NlpD